MRSLKAGIYGQAQEEMEAKDAKIKELEDQLAMVSDRARLEVDTHVYFPSAHHRLHIAALGSKPTSLWLPHNVDRSVLQLFTQLLVLVGQGGASAGDYEAPSLDIPEVENPVAAET